MKLFDFFKNGNKQESEAKPEYEKALAHFQEGAYQEALKSLRFGFQKDSSYPALYQLSADCLRALGGEEEALLFEHVLKHFKDANAFYQLGVHFLQVDQYDLATPFLEKSLALNPQLGEVAHDLAIVYSRRFRIQDALEVLEKSPDFQSFWDYWFWCKLRIMAEQTEGLEANLQELEQMLVQHPNKEEVIFPYQKLAEVREMLLRFQHIGKPEKNIQDWHFIQYGAMLLDFFEEPEQYVAGGRYVALWGSHETIKVIAERLKHYLDKLNIQFEKVYYLPDRNSEIIGRAIALEFGLESSVYEQETSEQVLFVSANSTDFDPYYDQLCKIKNGQVVFALNHSWLTASRICPDISGLMSQAYFFPWDGGGIRIVDAEKGLSERTEPDHRPAEEIAQSIFEEEVKVEIDQDSLNFYLQHQQYLKAGGSKVNDDRFNFMIESPIHGSYFG